MRQVNAVNGSQMVVKIGVVYYRRVKGKERDKLEYVCLLFIVLIVFVLVAAQHEAETNTNRQSDRHPQSHITGCCSNSRPYRNSYAHTDW